MGYPSFQPVEYISQGCWRFPARPLDPSPRLLRALLVEFSMASFQQDVDDLKRKVRRRRPGNPGDPGDRFLRSVWAAEIGLEPWGTCVEPCFFCHFFNGNFRNLNWRYLPYIRAM